jgi:hypothetical protein
VVRYLADHTDPRMSEIGSLQSSQYIVNQGSFQISTSMCIAFRFQLTLVVGHAGAMLAEKRGEQPQRARQLRRKRGSHLRTRLCFAHDEE